MSSEEEDEIAPAALTSVHIWDRAVTGVGLKSPFLGWRPEPPQPLSSDSNMPPPERKATQATLVGFSWNAGPQDVVKQFI
jgi:hypothetical protein